VRYIDRVLRDRPRLRKIVYFFPFQLLLVQFKKNHLLLFYWFILFGFATQKMAAKYGIPYLFLNPEYLDKVNFLSYFIVGIGLGGLIIAFNISSYIMNSFRFPFLATLSNPFPKYIVNNFIIPACFTLVYAVNIFIFQIRDQFETVANAAIDVLSLLAGVFAFIFLAITYFFRTNKDIYRLFNVQTADAPSGQVKSTSKVVMRKNMSWKALNESERDWKVETYLSGTFRIRIARGYGHYEKEKLLGVFKQNHTNAAVFEFVVVISILILGFFREVPAFGIPAGASVLLIFTMYLMLTSAVYNWLRGWSTTLFFVMILLINAAFAWDVFYVTNAAYGMNYEGKFPVYKNKEVEALATDSANFELDKEGTLNTLNKWRLKNTVNSLTRKEKPRLVIINASGGGLRSSLWSFYSLQYADSLLHGELLNHTVLITGASGGMVGVAYLRELYFRKTMNRLRNLYHRKYAHDISTDLLNPIVFSMTVNDLFLRIQNVHVGKYNYKKDRGYAFEHKLNQITRYYLDKPMMDYADAEKNAMIPMMIFTPTIINDGRRLYVSSQNVSYLCHPQLGDNMKMERLSEGIEFRRFFKKQDADQLRFTTALRMSATFPVIMPIVTLPSTPEMHVVDAGGKDNLGLETALKFLYTFRNWINTNTSGVVIIQVRDRHKKVQDDAKGNQSLMESLTAPIESLYGNIFSVQDYAQDQLLEYAGLWFDGKLEVINFQLRNQKPDKISLSWHLTEKEKQKVFNSIELPENRQAIERVRKLLE
jgi:hypothetical protein